MNMSEQLSEEEKEKNLFSRRVVTLYGDDCYRTKGFK